MEWEIVLPGTPINVGQAGHADIETTQVLAITEIRQIIDAILSGESGEITSVNGQTGIVVLDAEDVGARADDWEPDLSGYATTSDLDDLVSGTGITDIVSITQTDYDNLATKDGTTLYIIIEA